MKRGVIGNFVLLIGAMIIMIVLFLSYARIFLWTGSNVERDMAEDLADNVKSVIENMEAYPSNAKLIIKLPRPFEYELSISENEVLVTLRDKVAVKKHFFARNSITLPSSIKNSQVIEVYKTEQHIYVTDEVVCDDNDNICDPGCAVNKVCDSSCYIDKQKDSVCNLFCVDVYIDGVIDIKDIDGICDPDCEGEFSDIDCICPQCSNGKQDCDETGVDCGGSCKPCGSSGMCALDSDCGNRMEWKRLCQNGNINIQYLDFKCINPGLENSYCSPVTSIILDQCANGCSGGYCCE